jgi:hypothetical protein
MKRKYLAIGLVILLGVLLGALLLRAHIASIACRSVVEGSARIGCAK